VAVIGQRPVGFIDLEPNGHLDMLFVHPDHHGIGVAGALIRRVKTAARIGGHGRIFTEVSITARPLFERHGFRVTAEQSVECRGQWLTTYRMEKPLA
jgi:putative acetyltransferase